MTRELNIICQACNKPIDDGDGGLWLGADELRTRQDEHAAWEAASAAKSIGILPHPGRAHWQAHHFDCDDTGKSDAYNIPAEKLRTWADLVEWTSHLMPKEWIGGTDWAPMLSGIASGDSGRVVPVVKPLLNA